ncbi:unnamed protein product [Caenorhabditis auriculariae]|uniref:Uncharacterized protein n=1 Tax=Caenorhabditis auriculariae TaxID=2777116 RepID=A0A8S1HZG6_9PELO|nr:unnamed protein product [Caenorhabditis auriculariae]
MRLPTLFLDREGTWRLSRGLEAPCRNGPTTNCEIKELNEAMNARNSREKEELKRKKEKDGKQAEKK